MAATSAARPLPSQASQVDAHLQHGDWFAGAGQIAPALAMYRMAATQCEQHGELGRASAIYARIARLDPDRFVRIHRSHIVNADRIKELQPGAGDHAVILRSGVKLPLSRGYKDRLQEKLGRAV